MIGRVKAQSTAPSRRSPLGDNIMTVSPVRALSDAEVTQRLGQVYAYILQLARANNHDEEENRGNETIPDATSGTSETTSTLQQKSSGDNNPVREASPEDNSPDLTVGAYDGG